MTGKPDFLSELKDLFAKEGPLAERLKGYAPRSQQIRMAQAVGHALAESQTLVAEAGTGVGKSLAYLIPCALWAAQNGKKVWVATYTRALQQQLIVKDLPIVQSIVRRLGLSFRYALLMGAENFLCIQRLRHCVSQTKELFDQKEEQESLHQLFQWAKRSATGLKSSIPFSVPPSIWKSVCRDSEICLGRRGPDWQACLYRKDLVAARQSDLVVINQHLLFAGVPLPDYDALVVDEAHNLEAVASDFLGFELTDRALKRLFDDIANPNTGHGLAFRLGRHQGHGLDGVEEAIQQARASAKGFFDQIQTVVFSRQRKSASSVDSSLAVRLQRPHPVQDTFSRTMDVLADKLREAVILSQTAEEETEARAYVERCRRVSSEVREYLACASVGSAYWMESGTSRSGSFVALRRAPLDVSIEVRQRLFESHRPTILTSATLAVNGSLKGWRKSVGIDEAQELLLDSPFHYEERAALYVDPGIDDPAREPQAYADGVIRRCLEIIRMVPGGTFILLTSWELLERTYTHLQGAAVERPLFKQGDQPPYALLEMFRRSTNGVLLGTDTFWQGVDVPGSALSCVIITRLPFLVPDSPLESARREWLVSQGKDAFEDHVLPKAVIKFRQGFGRLIRRVEDAGAIVILDPRVRTRPYGAVFLNSIPRCRTVETLEELRIFFQQLAANRTPHLETDPRGDSTR